MCQSIGTSNRVAAMSIFQSSDPLVPANEAERLNLVASLDILDTPREATFDRLARLVHQIFEVPIALVTLMDANRQWYKACIGLDAESVERRDSFCQIPVATGAPMVVTDTLLDPRFSDHPYVTEEPFIRFYAGMPLMLDGDKCVGTLCAIDMVPRTFTQRDLSILGDLAAIVEAGLQLRRTAQIDPLTGALTRRGFKFAANQYLQERRTAQFPISVMMLDIDHFKRINDTYGHACGDAVLSTVARLCLGSLREADLFARMGGEEFAILLPATDAAGASIVAEKLRQTIEAESISLEGKSVSVTASFGVTTTTTPGASIEVLLDRADKALYLAKRGGRNRVETATA
jgi:diguanylate cyclase (GGDEF)-like protein